jgi:hypothetical protein
VLKGIDTALELGLPVKVNCVATKGFNEDELTDFVSRCVVPLVSGRNLQCQPVRGVNFREECHWIPRMFACKFLPKKAHRAVRCSLRLYVPPCVAHVLALAASDHPWHLA